MMGAQAFQPSDPSVFWYRNGRYVRPPTSGNRAFAWGFLYPEVDRIWDLQTFPF